jgi:hypothetical protein
MDDGKSNPQRVIMCWPSLREAGIMRAAVFATTTVLGLALCGSARAESNPTWFWGIGRQSCAYWLSSGDVVKEAGEHWIQGFWSGANVFNPDDHLVGRGTDAAGIWGEVRKACAEHPSWAIFQAATKAYNLIKDQHR